MCGAEFDTRIVRKMSSLKVVVFKLFLISDFS